MPDRLGRVRKAAGLWIANMFKKPVENSQKSKEDFNVENALGFVASTSGSPMDDQQWDHEADTLALTQLSKVVSTMIKTPALYVTSDLAYYTNLENPIKSDFTRAVGSNDSRVKSRPNKYKMRIKHQLQYVAGFPEIQERHIGDKFRNKGAVVLELPKALKRDFSPCFAPNSEGGIGHNNTRFIGNDSSSKEEVDFLSQDVRVEMERLRKILNLKEGENKILRDSKEEEAKKHQETLRQNAAIIETLKKELAEIKQAHKNEWDALSSKNKFLEQEKDDLERKYNHEKCIRRKAESDIKEIIVSTKNDGAAPLTRGACNQILSGCTGGVSTKEFSQFPNKNEFFSPSQAIVTIENGKDNKRRKRTTTPNKAASKRFNTDGCGGDDVTFVRAPKKLTFAAADMSIQTETPPRVKRSFVLTQFLEESEDFQFMPVA
uniref:Uncharacterized protein n=1 Tax=Romanomermis culicivorax TaxID=13658 RepID=A0A915JN86_ROMCU